jgi:hypothetical protein
MRACRLSANETPTSELCRYPFGRLVVGAREQVRVRRQQDVGVVANLALSQRNGARMTAERPGRLPGAL